MVPHDPVTAEFDRVKDYPESRSDDGARSQGTSLKIPTISACAEERSILLTNFYRLVLVQRQTCIGAGDLEAGSVLQWDAFCRCTKS